MKYQIKDLQVFTHPKAEQMFQFPALGLVEFEYPGTVRTLLFIYCGEVKGSLRGGEDYYQVVGRIYESANPEAENEDHIGKLYIDVYGFPNNTRFQTKVERLEWYSDGSFDLIEPNGKRTRFNKPKNYEDDIGRERSVPSSSLSTGRGSSPAKIRDELAKLENKYPDQLLVIRSSAELDKAFNSRKYEILNGESFFLKNNDPFADIIGKIESALDSGKQVSIQAAGSEGVLVMIAKPGKTLFQPRGSFGYRSQATFAPALNQTLPTVSIVLGILGIILVCCWGGVPLGIGAIITGFIGMNNANSNPENYGGYGLAIAGMATGVFSLFITLIFALFSILR